MCNSTTQKHRCYSIESQERWKEIWVTSQRNILCGLMKQCLLYDKYFSSICYILIVALTQTVVLQWNDLWWEPVPILLVFIKFVIVTEGLLSGKERDVDVVLNSSESSRLRGTVPAEIQNHKKAWCWSESPLAINIKQTAKFSRTGIYIRNSVVLFSLIICLIIRIRYSKQT